MTRDNNRPAFRCCDSCGRNDWKVAIRYRKLQTANNIGKPRHVMGYCPSCFADDLRARPGVPGVLAPSPAPVDYWIKAGAVLVADLRGERSRKLAPVPAALLPKPKPAPGTTGEDEHGLRVWAACGHRAERDINDNCYTCGRAV